MLTPTRYWRVAQSLAELDETPPREFELPTALTNQTLPPTVGDGLLLADYDATAQSGLVRYLGIVRARTPRCVEVDWLPTTTEIWVDTPAGRGNWATKPGFGFAKTKVAGYGLHHLFAETFSDLVPRTALPNGARSIPSARAPAVRKNSLPRERLDPIEIVGEPSAAARGGHVYVLKSAYGYKVGRSRNVPNRMRSFGVQLPILYTIPLCAWFDDHIEAESAFHRLFAEKRINGEWFDLDDRDIDRIRRRDYGGNEAH